ncbi:MAG: hypothetical protein GY724_07595 [Actinomycetia bacterium]|nr:hypothetical protein [Actinomycetes bacterium]
MSLSGSLLAAHIIAVAGWLGASLVLLTVGRSLAAAGTDVTGGFFRACLSLSKRYYNIAGVIVALSGVAMVLNGQAEWGSTFISIGFLAVIIGAVMGPTVFSRLFSSGIEAADAGDGPATRAVWAKVQGGLVIDITVVIITIAAMVERWGL